MLVAIYQSTMHTIPQDMKVRNQRSSKLTGTFFVVNGRLK